MWLGTGSFAGKKRPKRAGPEGWVRNRRQGRRARGALAQPCTAFFELLFFAAPDNSPAASLLFQLHSGWWSRVVVVAPTTHRAGQGSHEYWPAPIFVQIRYGFHGAPATGRLVNGDVASVGSILSSVSSIYLTILQCKSPPSCHPLFPLPRQRIVWSTHGSRMYPHVIDMLVHARDIPCLCADSYPVPCV